jgi:glycosyltransferase involved in cell wall biosynthesis
VIDQPVYSAVIRTHNSAPLVFKVVAALRAQTRPPVSIIVVDSGSGAADIAEIRLVVDRVVDISRQTFNYSRAINVGVAECETTNVLIRSSHLLLNVSTVMEEFFTE